MQERRYPPRWQFQNFVFYKVMEKGTLSALEIGQFPEQNGKRSKDKGGE